MKKYVFVILSIFFTYSCSSDKEGNWDDIIKLSTRNVEFSAQADSVIITTKGDWWWINGISIGDKIYNTSNREDINLESNLYAIKEDCFVVERRKNALFVKLNENNTGIERVLEIFLEAGDYFDFVHIKQTAN